MTKPVAVRKARALAQAMVLRDERAKAAAKKRRSAAARKGWATRRAKRDLDKMILPRWDYWSTVEDFRKTVIEPRTGIPDIVRGLPPDPNPWPRLAAKVRRWWQRATQWWR